MEVIAIPHRLTHWFRLNFLAPQTRRDEDLEHWWQLPNDPTRVTSAWRQLFVDLIAPATFSEWHERITETRVAMYDRLRPTAARTVFLTAIAAALVVLGSPWWIWLMLLPAVLQSALEIHMAQYMSKAAPEPRRRIIARIRDVARKHFNTRLLNVTGVLGAIACPLNVAAACFAPAGNINGWAKVFALGAAIFYLNSGLASTFLDPPNYTEASVMPPVMHHLRPYVPLLSFAVVSCLVALSAWVGRWEPAVLPLAYLCSALTLLLGSTIRNHDRMVAAGARVARQAVEEGRQVLGRVVHDDLGPAKAAAESVSSVPGVPYPDVVDLRALAAYLKHFNTRIGLYATQRMHLEYIVEKLVSPYGISPRQVTFDIRWDQGAVRKEDHQVAIRMVTALVHNLAQALERDENLGASKAFTVRGSTTGEGRELRYHLAVRDHLPVIPPDQWCAAGGSLAALQAWLHRDFNGELIQQDLGDGTKEIVASWDDRSPANEPEALQHATEPKPCTS